MTPKEANGLKVGMPVMTRLYRSKWYMVSYGGPSKERKGLHVVIAGDHEMVVPLHNLRWCEAIKKKVK